MAVRQHGFTRVSALGPIAALIEAHGESPAHVFAGVDLPYLLLDHPDLPIPLKEQFRLLESAARATGDQHFGARLGQYVRADKLSAFGKWVCEADSLAVGIERANWGLNAFLQTATALTFVRGSEVSTWSIEFLDPEIIGRYQNELLGVSYLIDTVRSFVGQEWMPRYVATTCPYENQAGKLEHIFGTNVIVGQKISTIEIPSALLSAPARRLKGFGAPASASIADEPDVPMGLKGREAIIALTRLALLESYPRLDWVAGKMGLTRRTFQRRLKEFDITFSEVVSHVVSARATELLSRSNMSITDIALSLGYQDLAHFSRAFKRWTGMTPGIYRRSSTAFENGR